MTDIRDDHELLEVVGRRLADYQLELAVESHGDTHSDLIAVLRNGAAQTRVALELTANPSFNTVARIVGALRRSQEILATPSLMVIAPHIAERTGAAYRDRGIFYADAAGNAYVAFDGVRIDVRGRKRVASASHESSTGASGYLYSPKRAQIIFAVVTWPGIEYGPARDLARRAGASVGLVSSTLRLLETERSVLERITRQDGTEALIDQWVRSYPTGLGARLGIRSFSGDVDTVDLPPGGSLSGEWAVRDLIKPTTMTIYVDEFDPRTAIVNRWRSDRDSNVFIRRRFWDQDEAAEVVPPLLVYADLIASGDPRQLEIAAQYRMLNDGLHAR